MATKETTSTYRRATDFSKGIGESLETVADKDMVLHAYERSTRIMEGEQTDFVSLTLSTLDDEENKIVFHAWSASLGERLDEVGQDNLPVIVKFTQAKTRAGYKVWTIE